MVLLIKQEVTMKRTLLSLIALGALVSSFAGTVAVAVVRAGTIWGYQDGSGDQTADPQCLGPNNVCAREFNLNSDGSLGSATGNTKPGVRND